MGKGYLAIKGDLIKGGHKLSEIAQELNVDRSLVTRVIQGNATSDRVQRAIARRLHRPVSKVFPGSRRPRRRNVRGAA